ncbi:MAG: hypothetical protein ACUZ8O_02060, partial [Candidatus Anammoxibacter sp.]
NKIWYKIIFENTDNKTGSVIMKLLLITVLLVLLFSFTANADETNYCHDPEVNLQWEMLVNKYTLAIRNCPHYTLYEWDYATR